MGPKTDLKANLWEKWSTTCTLAEFASGREMVISFTLLREVGRSQSQRGVKHRVEIDDFQL